MVFRSLNRIFAVENLYTMRKTVHYIILFVAACMLLAACGRRATDAERLLARIDSLADVNPDSADILLSRSPLLRALGSAAFRATAGKEGGVRGGSDKARILLRIKTDDKLYRPVTHYRDTILQLIDYFEHHSKVLPSLLGSTGPALPYLYAGRIFADLGDAPQALDYYQQALDVQPDIPSPIGKSREELSLAKQRGLLYSFIGIQFFYQGLYAEAANSFKEANRWAEVVQDTVDIIFNYRDIAEQYKFLEKNDSSLHFYQKALKYAEASKNSRRINDILSQIAELYSKQGNYQVAYDYIQPPLQEIDSTNMSALYNIASKIYRHLGKEDSALICYKKLLQFGNIYGKRNAYRELSELALKRGDIYTASEHFHQYKLLDDSIRARDNAETVARMHAAYNYQKHEREASRLRESNARMRLWLMLGAFFLVVSFSILLLARIRQAYMRKLERSTMSKVEILRLSYEQGLPEKEKAQAAIEGSAIYKTIGQHISEGKVGGLSENDWEELAQIVNSAYPNFKKKLNELVSLNEQDYRICLLTKINVKPIHIAQLTAHSPEAISSSRRRLYQKCTNKKGKPQDWDEIIHLL